MWAGNNDAGVRASALGARIRPTSDASPYRNSRTLSPIPESTGTIFSPPSASLVPRDDINHRALPMRSHHFQASIKVSEQQHGHASMYTDVYWNCSPQGISDVIVVLNPFQHPDADDPIIGPSLRDTYRRVGETRLCFDHCQRGPNGPARIFGQLFATGFIDAKESRVALEEFARIEDCDWAREMLTAFDD